MISGGAAGVDQLAERWAWENNTPLRIIKPDYTRHGNQAPILRNLQIVEAADRIFALWDGQSAGTRMALDYARKQGKPVVCQMIQDEQQLSLF